MLVKGATEMKNCRVSGQILTQKHNPLQYLTTAQAYQQYRLFVKGSISIGLFQIIWKINMAFSSEMGLFKWVRTEVLLTFTYHCYDNVPI